METYKQNRIPHSIRPDVAFRVCIGMLFFLALVMRLWNITGFPGWFRDEGNYFAVCHSLFQQGKAALGPLNITFCSPFMTHPPFYFYTGAAWLTIIHGSLTSLRIFNVVLGMATLVLVFLFMVRHFRKTAVLIAIAAFALNPHIVTFNRMILPYNLYLLIGFGIFVLAVEYVQRPDWHLYLTVCVLAFFAVLTVYYAVSLVVFLLIIAIHKRGWRHTPFLLIPCLALPLLFLVQTLSHTPGFAEDVSALQRAAVAGSIIQIIMHYKDFLLTGVIFFLGTLGLFFIRVPGIRWMAIMFVIVVLFPVMRKADTIIRFVSYPLIPILPLMAVGISSFFDFVIRSLSRVKIQPVVAGILVGLLVIVCVLPDFVVEDARGIRIRFPEPLRFAMVQNTADAEKAALYVNSRTEPGDLVIASYPIWHLLNTKKSNIPIALAYAGIESDFFLYTLSKDRFSFDPSVKNAAYVMCDFLTDQMKKSPVDSFHYPVAKVLLRIETEWQKVGTFGEFTIYENPEKNP